MANWTWEDGGVLSAELKTGSVKINVIQYRASAKGTTWWAWLGESNVAFASGKGDSLEDGKQNALREVREVLMGALGDVGVPFDAPPTQDTPNALYSPELPRFEMPSSIYFPASRKEIYFGVGTRWVNGNYRGVDQHGDEFGLDGLTQEVVERYLRARRVVEIVAKRLPWTRTSEKSGRVLALVVSTELVDALAAVDKAYVFQYPTLKAE